MDIDIYSGMRWNLLVGLITGLIIGIVIGYGSAFRRIGSLESQVSSLQGQISSQETQITILEKQLADNLTLVAQLKTWLSGNLTKNAQLQTQVSILTEQAENLTSQIVLLETQTLQLEETIASLRAEVEELRYRISLVNAPVSALVKGKDLIMTISLPYTVYSYRESVIYGNVTVVYVNGTAFEGMFSIYILPLFGGWGMTNYPAVALTNGFGEFYLASTPGWPIFRYGPGKYRVGIAGLTTVEGYVIPELGETPYVDIEAK